MLVWKTKKYNKKIYRSRKLPKELLTPRHTFIAEKCSSNEQLLGKNKKNNGKVYWEVLPEKKRYRKALGLVIELLVVNFKLVFKNTVMYYRLTAIFAHIKRLGLAFNLGSTFRFEVAFHYVHEMNEIPGPITSGGEGPLGWRITLHVAKHA